MRPRTKGCPWEPAHRSHVAPPLPMQVGDCARHCASPAFGEERVADQHPDACSRGGMLHGRHGRFVSPALTNGGAAALMPSPRSTRRGPRGATIALILGRRPGPKRHLGTTAPALRSRANRTSAPSLVAVTACICASSPTAGTVTPSLCARSECPRRRRCRSDETRTGDERDPLISTVATSPAGRAKRKPAPAVGDRDRTRASSPRRSPACVPTELQSDRRGDVRFPPPCGSLALRRGDARAGYGAGTDGRSPARTGICRHGVLNGP